MAPLNSTADELFTSLVANLSRIQQLVNNVLVNTKVKRGRPSGDSKERKASIAAAATELFGTMGYDNCSIRLIAEKAGVDPKLVSHYFGSKASLFAAILSLPPQAQGAMAVLRDIPIDKWGESIAKIVLDKNGVFSVTQLVGVIKSASNDPQVASTIREFYLKQSLEPLLEAFGLDNPKVRASALSSVLAGFTFSDQILQIPVGTAAQSELRAKMIGQVIQTILTERL